MKNVKTFIPKYSNLNFIGAYRHAIKDYHNRGYRGVELQSISLLDTLTGAFNDRTAYLHVDVIVIGADRLLNAMACYMAAMQGKRVLLYETNINPQYPYNLMDNMRFRFSPENFPRLVYSVLGESLSQAEPKLSYQGLIHKINQMTLEHISSQEDGDTPSVLRTEKELYINERPNGGYQLLHNSRLNDNPLVPISDDIAKLPLLIHRERFKRLWLPDLMYRIDLVATKIVATSDCTQLVSNFDSSNVLLVGAAKMPTHEIEHFGITQRANDLTSLHQALKEL
ncbi:hypothetical protein AB6D11_02840 [Vibrio splendidus]